MAVVRCVRHNPADPESGLKLWSNGLIQSFGAVSVPGDWEPPETWGNTSAQDMQIVDWLTPSGYVLSHTGRVFHFGGVTPATNTQDFGNLHLFKRLVVNPFGNGAGYEMDVLGRIWKFGPVLPPNVGIHPDLTRTGNIAGGINWGVAQAVDLHMDWATKRYAILSDKGHLYSPDFTITWDPADVRPLQEGRSLYRAVAFVNPLIPVGDTAGYITTYTGRCFGFNSAEHIRPFAIWPDQDVAVDLNVVSDGRSGRPLIIEVAHEAGIRRNLTVSVPPQVVVIAPSSTVSNTTRPDAIWDYMDADGDAQGRAEVKLFTSAQYGAGGFDPATSAAYASWTVTDQNTFRVDPDFDLANGNWRYYVKVTDTAGDSSDWEFKQFNQNVVPPDAPSVAVDADEQTWTTSVTVTAAGGTASGLSAVAEYSDDEGVTWETVVGGVVAYPSSGPKVVTVEDWQAPFNNTRRYRARTIQPDPYLTSAASSSANAMIASDEWVLSDPATGEGMAVEWVPERTDTRDTGAAAHYPLGRGTAVVTRTGMRGATLPVTIRTMSRAEHDRLEALLVLGTVQLRDPYERNLFVSVVGEIERTFLELAPEPTEVTEFRYAHTHSFSVVQVDRPAP